MTSITLATLARRAADLGNPLPCSDDTQLWFSEHPADLELAKAMCESCPLRRACLAGAIDRAEPFGVWGGEIFVRDWSSDVCSSDLLRDNYTGITITVWFDRH